MKIIFLVILGLGAGMKLSHADGFQVCSPSDLARGCIDKSVEVQCYNPMVGHYPCNVNFCSCTKNSEDASFEAQPEDGE